MLSRELYIAVLVLIAGTIAASCQDRNLQQPPVKGTAGALSIQPIKTGLYSISGGGCNSVLRLSANGSILVDGKLPGNYESLVSQVRRISELPIRALVLTDREDAHIGNNAQFLQAGVRIVAQENTKSSLPVYTLSDGKSAPPIVTYDREYSIHMGGIEARLLHFGQAHTDGDTVVYFPNLKVVAVGELFASTPNPDFSAGGSLVNWGPVLGQILKLDFDTVVPGTGTAASRADLEKFKTKIDTLVSNAKALVKRGVPKEQLMAQLETDDLGWHFNFTPDQLDRFYDELSRTD